MNTRRFATPLAVLASGGFVGFGLLRNGSPGDWLWQFFYNMRMPLTAVFLAVTVVGTYVATDAMRERKKFGRETEDYAIMDWRVWTSVNLIGIMAILWLMIMAVPSPTFRKEIQYVLRTQTRTVTQKIPVRIYQQGTRVVYHSPTYVEAYQLCVDNWAGDYSDKTPRCHAQALQASAPPGHFKVITRTITYKDPYEVLFNLCEDKLDSSYVSAVEACQKFAMRIPPQPEK